MNDPYVNKLITCINIKISTQGIEPWLTDLKVCCTTITLYGFYIHFQF